MRDATIERVTLTPKQSNVYAWGWQPEARHRVAVCGRRFGKTFLAIREIKRAARLAAKWDIHPDNEIWFGSPTFKQAKKNFWQRIKRAIPADWLSGTWENECRMTLVTGHIIRLVGLDNFNDLRGSGLFFFVGDEWGDTKAEAWTETVRPMLSTCNGHSLKIGTPKGFNHFYDDFQKGQPGAVDEDGVPIVGHKSWVYTTIQGGNVPLVEIAEAKRDLSAQEFRQEYEATFEAYEGRVLYAFVRSENVRPCKYDPSQDVHIGMDFNVNPMSATLWQERDGASHQIGEIIIPTSNTDEMVAEIKRRYSRNGAVGHITVYPDPAGAQRRTSAQGRTDISILRDAKFRVLAMTSHPLVRDRVNKTNARFCNELGERRAFVDPSCRVSITAYERLTYKEGTSDPDKDGGFDHPCDATCYYIYGRFNYQGPYGAQSNHIGR